MKTELRPAKIGSISTGTLRPEDLLTAYLQALESLTLLSGQYLSEHHDERDRYANLIGEAQDCFSEDGETIDPDKEDTADDVINDIHDALQDFAPPYCYFGSHPGDGADIGFWPMDIEDVKDLVGFVSSRSQEYPDDNFVGEWLHINDHGNCTLYVRSDGEDVELWSIV